MPRNATSFNGDPARLAVGGASAGANLAAVTCLRAREQGTPAIIFQLLTVPATNFNFDTVSHRENGEGYGLTRSVMEWFRDHYLNHPRRWFTSLRLTSAGRRFVPPATRLCHDRRI